MSETLIYLCALIPSATVALTSIATTIGILSKFNTLRSDVKKKVEMEEVQQKLEVVLSENRELQRILKKEIETHTHVKED